MECSSLLASSGHCIDDLISRLFHKAQPGIPRLHGAAYRYRTMRVRLHFVGRHNAAIISTVTPKAMHCSEPGGGVVDAIIAPVRRGAEPERSATAQP